VQAHPRQLRRLGAELGQVQARLTLSKAYVFWTLVPAATSWLMTSTDSRQQQGAHLGGHLRFLANRCALQLAVAKRQ